MYVYIIRFWNHIVCIPIYICLISSHVWFVYRCFCVRACQNRTQPPAQFWVATCVLWKPPEVSSDLILTDFKCGLRGYKRSVQFLDVMNCLWETKVAHVDLLVHFAPSYDCKSSNVAFCMAGSSIRTAEQKSLFGIVWTTWRSSDRSRFELLFTLIWHGIATFYLRKTGYVFLFPILMLMLATPGHFGQISVSSNAANEVWCFSATFLTFVVGNPMA